jgi:putative transposase
MGNTYVQFYIHLIFAVKFREAVIDPSWKPSLYQHIRGIVTSYGHKLFIINGMPDHLHLLISVRPSQSVSDLVQRIKGNSSKWINDNQLTSKHFRWQKGYACFSCSQSTLPKVINYIKNQEKHHQKKKFLEEYVAFLEAFEIDYEERYLFQELE